MDGTVKETYHRCVDFLRLYSALSLILSIELFYHLFNIERDPSGVTRAYTFLDRLLRDLAISGEGWAALVFSLTVAGSLLIFLFPKKRSLRVFQWIMSVLAVSLPIAMIPGEGVPGGPDLRYLGWVWINFILIFLPVGKEEDSAYQQDFTYVIWASIASVLLFYSLSGLAKFSILAEGLLTGPADSFVPFYPSCLMEGSFSFRFGETKGMLADFVIHHEYLNFAGFIAFACLEVACFPLAFYPRFHKALGIALLLFHLMTMVLLRMNFFPLYLLAGVMLLCSPFSESRSQKL